MNRHWTIESRYDDGFAAAWGVFDTEAEARLWLSYVAWEELADDVDAPDEACYTTDELRTEIERVVETGDASAWGVWIRVRPFDLQPGKVVVDRDELNDGSFCCESCLVHGDC